MERESCVEWAGEGVGEKVCQGKSCGLGPQYHVRAVSQAMEGLSVECSILSPVALAVAVGVQYCSWGKIIGIWPSEDWEMRNISKISNC